MAAGCAPFSSTPAGAGAAQTRLQLGLEYLARDQVEAARDNLQKAERLAPTDIPVQLGIALYEQHVGDNQAAEKRYQHLLQRSPANGSVLNNYGAFLCRLGQYVAAQRQFDAAAQLADYHHVADALENAGYCFLNAGRTTDAAQWLGRALRYEPGKGKRLLAEARSRFDAGYYCQAQMLLKVYQPRFAASPESLWLQIRFAAQAKKHDDVERYGRQLARSFPQSKQYQQFLANEY
ncbi:type IV pilus biogenesis/stability protein PilW [Dickeya lacustris]|uniref:Type IV pilus biogenesis/stability protein PilW n=2 Tax=Dickeya lacustris TaxID=2259638 RepID=A0ABY8GCK8_9GAMM|nr:type IV pilus biogenesis/stability protein PilW [Dickeya lacustris]WFN57564.1 type IV pilus biogenesis/stability protein PilW [Dickeya lacustris]